MPQNQYLRKSLAVCRGFLHEADPGIAQAEFAPFGLNPMIRCSSHHNPPPQLA